MGVAAQLLTFCAQVAASQHLPVAAHGRSLDVAPTAGFNVNYGGCRSCVEGVFDCAYNDEGPSAGLFTTIGFHSDFEPDAAPTSNADCASACSADADCIGFEIRIPEEGKPALCENWKKGVDSKGIPVAVYPQKPDTDATNNFRCYIKEPPGASPQPSPPPSASPSPPPSASPSLPSVLASPPPTPSVLASPPPPSPASSPPPASTVFEENFGGCRNCAEGTFECGHNDDGPSLGLFITIGQSNFEPDAAPTSNSDCASTCAADGDCIGYEIRIPEEGKPAL